MFHESVRAVIEKQCRLLREETAVLGRVFAAADPDDPEAVPLDVPAARRACRDLLHRAEAMGADEVLERARPLDAGLAALEQQARIHCWDLVEVMGLHADLAAAVGEIEAEDTELYAGCTAPSATTVAPPPAFR